MTYAHPLAWKELFNAKTSLSPWYLLEVSDILPHNFTIDALAKLFMYGSYVKARAAVVNRNRLFLSKNVQFQKTILRLQ